MNEEEKKTRFESWYGMPVEENMDIQTEVAWSNWCAAWDDAVDCIVKSGNGYICVVREKMLSFSEWNKND